MKDPLPKIYLCNLTMKQAYQVLMDLQHYEYLPYCAVHLSPPDDNYCHFNIYQQVHRSRVHIEGLLKVVPEGQLELTFTTIGHSIGDMPRGCYALMMIVAVIGIGYFYPVAGMIAAIIGIIFLSVAYKFPNEEQEIQYDEETVAIIYRMTHVLEATPKYPVVDN